MGTRSLTVFVDEQDKEIAVLYRQFDGYPDGHGLDLCDILGKRALVNGFTMEQQKQGAYNGMADLAVRVIHCLKVKNDGRTFDHKSSKYKKINADRAGQFYLYPAGTRDCGEEYTYVVRADGTRPHLIVRDDNNKLCYSGLPEQVLAAIKKKAKK